VTRLRAGRLRNLGSIPAGTKNFPFLPIVQTASVFHRASYFMVSGIGWPEREIDDKNDSSYACIHPVRVLQQFSVPYKAVVLEDEKKEQEVL